MNRKLAWCILPLVAGLQSLSVAADGLAPEQIRQFSVDCWRTLREAEYARTDSFIADGTHLASASLAAATDVRMAEWTGDKSYLKSAAARLKEVARRGLQTNEADFFTSFPFTWAYVQVTKEGLADEELQDLARKFADQKFKPRDEGQVFNQTFIRACGLAMAAKTWPQATMAPAWSKYANTILDGFLKLEDTPENSTDYNAFDLICPFLLADLLGRTEDLRKDGVKKYYERFLAQLSPAGFIPPYGDAGAAPRSFTPDWPVENAWGFYVSAFERAAAFWSDPQFRWAAERLYEAGSKYQKLTRGYADLQELFYLTFAPGWIDKSLPTVMPPLRSEVLTRADQAGPAQLDKLVLAFSHAPGMPYLLADLYARGAHAHENQPGAIVYYEYGGQALLASLGYNSRNPEYANLTILHNGDSPFTEGLFQPGVWHETLLPTERMAVISPDKPDLRHIQDAVFRVTGGDKGVEVAISQTGPDRSRRPGAASRNDGQRFPMDWKIPAHRS